MVVGIGGGNCSCYLVEDSLEPDRVTDQPAKEPRSAGGLDTRLGGGRAQSGSAFAVPIACGIHRVVPMQYQTV